MTPETLNRIKDDLGDATIDQFAKRFDRGRNGMADMLSGKSPIPRDIALAASALWIGGRINVDLTALVSIACDLPRKP